jgi:hypothetical protein
MPKQQIGRTETGTALRSPTMDAKDVRPPGTQMRRSPVSRPALVVPRRKSPPRWASSATTGCAHVAYHSGWSHMPSSSTTAPQPPPVATIAAHSCFNPDPGPGISAAASGRR